MGKKVIEVPIELQELIPIFLENRRNDIKDLHEFLKTKNYDSIAKLAHKIKGSAGGYGFSELTQIAAEMESFAKKADADKISDSIKKIVQIVDHSEIKFVD